MKFSKKLSQILLKIAWNFLKVEWISLCHFHTLSHSPKYFSLIYLLTYCWTAYGKYHDPPLYWRKYDIVMYIFFCNGYNKMLRGNISMFLGILGNYAEKLNWNNISVQSFKCFPSIFTALKNAHYFPMTLL